MSDDEVIDRDGLPHRRYDHDRDGVELLWPVCGIDGETWPCPTAKGETDD